MFMEIQFFLAQMKVNYRVSEVKTVKCPSSKFNFPLKPFWLPIISSWPSYEFHFEGLSNFSPLVEGLVWIQDVNLRVQKWNMKLILNLCMNYMVHVSSTMWRIKNQPSNSTSCSDNVLPLLILVAVFQDSTMSFQSINSTPNPFRLTLVKASGVSRLSLVLLSFLTQF